jgi:hypothetical protein
MNLHYHVTVQAVRGNYSQELLAHVKHTLTHPRDRDVVMCLVVRKYIPAETSAEEISRMAKEDGLVVEPVLRRLATEQGWLNDVLIAP